MSRLRALQVRGGRNVTAVAFCYVGAAAVAIGVVIAVVYYQAGHLHVFITLHVYNQGAPRAPNRRRDTIGVVRQLWNRAAFK